MRMANGDDERLEDSSDDVMDIVAHVERDM
jgi:hypothetical protein